MHGFMGSYLEKNINAMQDVQTKLGEQSKQMTPELWAQFMGLQSPSIQGLLNNNIEQSKNMMLQFQEQMQKQTEQMLETFGLKR
jgi:polyhydroxyalkanoate synthesis regulator protein